MTWLRKATLLGGVCAAAGTVTLAQAQTALDDSGYRSTQTFRSFQAAGGDEEARPTVMGRLEWLKARYGATLRLEVFDAYALFDDLLNHPTQYGFDDATRSCLDIPKPSSLTYLSSQTPRAACRDPARFVFWDTLHPTTRTHALFSERTASFLRERFGI